MPAPGGDAVRELMKAVQTGKITEADVDARLDELLEPPKRRWTPHPVSSMPMPTTRWHAGLLPRASCC